MHDFASIFAGRFILLTAVSAEAKAFLWERDYRSEHILTFEIDTIIPFLRDVTKAGLTIDGVKVNGDDDHRNAIQAATPNVVDPDQREQSQLQRYSLFGD